MYLQKDQEIPEQGHETETLPAHPVEIIAGQLERGLILLCDHAANFVPDDLDQLGVPAEQFDRHIGYDIGAADTTRELARLLGVPALLTTFSRLVIDPNRGRDDPTLVMRLSDGAVVPGNARINEAGIEERIRRFYDPYDAAITTMIEGALESGVTPAIVSIHSFTPVWRGVPRPWEIGLLWHQDKRMTDFLLAELAGSGLTIGDNEPYLGGLPGDTIDRHATRRGLANVLIELRQDLIATPQGAQNWARRLEPLLSKAASLPEMHEIRPIG